MSTETFFSYRNYRWMWATFGVLFGSLIAYFFNKPIGGRNGGTALGYGLGIYAALGIVYLMWFGIRKRSYYSKQTTLKGCLSAHVWLGITLAVIVPLHCGFSFGLNVHTLAYALMMVVVISGIYGAVNYGDLAPRIASHRGAGTVPKLLEQVHIVSNDINALIKDKSDQFLLLARVVDIKFKPGLIWSLFGSPIYEVKADQAAHLTAQLSGEESSAGLKLISLANKKRALASQVQNEVGILARLRLWLYLHLPLSFALLLALIVHIVVVLYYGSRPF